MDTSASRLLIVILLTACFISNAMSQTQSTYSSTTLARLSFRMEKRFTNSSSTFDTSTQHTSSVQTSSVSINRAPTSTTTESNTIQSVSKTDATESEPTLSRPWISTAAKGPSNSGLHLSTAAQIGIWTGVGIAVLASVAGLIFGPRIRRARLQRPRPKTTEMIHL